MSCPGREQLVEVAELRAELPEERRVRAHARACASCASRLGALDPVGALVASLPRSTLPDRAWDDVMRSVRREMEAHPRGERVAVLAWLERWIGGEVPAFATACASLLAVAVLTTALLSTGPRLAPSPVARLVDPAASSRPAAEEPAFASSFVYLSNPAAEVAHVLVSGEEGRAAVQVTMVIDATLAEGLF